MTRFISHRLATWAVAIAFGIPVSLLAAADNSPAKLKRDDTAIDRDVRTGHSYAAVIKKASPSVVNIYSTRTVSQPRIQQFFNDPLFERFFGGGGSPRRQRPQTFPQTSLGSGVIVTEDGYILTNNHVVDGADPNGVEVSLGDEKRKYTARVIGNDPQTDLAVLKVDAKDLPAITLADSDKLEVGDVVLAIGNPFDVGQSVTMGIVSALRRGGFKITDYEDFIQTDAAINPGNSGGALVDAQGRLVGINQSIVSRSGANVGVGFAVPVNLARVVLERLVEDGTMERGFLGVIIQELTPDLAKAFDLADTAGALVTDVLPQSPAAEAGIREEDVILEVNGKRSVDSQEARLMISQNRPGSKITLKIMRAGKPLTVSAKLGDLPQQEGTTFGDARGIQRETRDGLDGVEVEELTPAVRREAGIPAEVRGAFVSTVDPTSNAYAAGLRAGSVVQGIDRKPVRSAEEAVQLSDQAAGEQVLLRVWRREGATSGSHFLTVDIAPKKK